MHTQMHSHHGMYVLGACIYIYLYILVGAFECLRGGWWYFFQYDPNFRIMYIVFTDFTELSYSILDQYLHFKMLNTVFHGEGRHL